MDEISKSGSFIELVTLQAVTYKMLKIFIRQEKIPLKVGQLPVMMCIYDHGILCQQEIANAVFRDKSSIQRTVAKLEYYGFVEIRQNIDKRKKSLVLSETGKVIAKKIAGLMSSSPLQSRTLLWNG
ncbi:MAG: MarR family transcriptional regulator [Taibaiella sp.]|jgi:DNA-binding MarR family transcriptional regulator